MDQDVDFLVLQSRQPFHNLWDTIYNILSSRVQQFDHLPLHLQVLIIENLQIGPADTDRPDLMLTKQIFIPSCSLVTDEDAFGEGMDGQLKVTDLQLVAAITYPVLTLKYRWKTPAQVLSALTRCRHSSHYSSSIPCPSSSSCPSRPSCPSCPSIKLNKRTIKFDTLKLIIIIKISRNSMSGGKDDKGSYYPSINDMWEMELNNKKVEGKGKVVDPVGSQENWYNKANQYWKNSQASYNGVLGGFENLSSSDISASFKFILEYFKAHPEHTRNRVIDCGAGIGRIAKQLLCQVYKTVDLIDQCEKYIDKAKQILKDKKNIGHFYAKGLQEFDFEQKYDCVWIQWVISHLTDDDAVKFLLKAKSALTEHGFILLKQNSCSKGFIVDKEDFSVTRSKELFVEIFRKAELKIVKEELQSNWPKGMFQVKMYLLR